MICAPGKDLVHGPAWAEEECAFGQRAEARKRREAGAGGKMGGEDGGAARSQARSTGIGGGDEGFWEVPGHPTAGVGLGIPDHRQHVVKRIDLIGSTGLNQAHEQVPDIRPARV